MIATYLDLSTSHVSRKTMELLETMTSRDRLGSGWPAMTVANYEYGCFITVPGTDADESMQALPDDLCTLLTHARRLAVSLVRLDADGDVTYQLPIYDW